MPRDDNPEFARVETSTHRFALFLRRTGAIYQCTTVANSVTWFVERRSAAIAVYGYDGMTKYHIRNDLVDDAIGAGEVDRRIPD